MHDDAGIERDLAVIATLRVTAAYIDLLYSVNISLLSFLSALFQPHLVMYTWLYTRDH